MKCPKCGNEMEEYQMRYTDGTWTRSIGYRCNCKPSPSIPQEPGENDPPILLVQQALSEQMRISQRGAFGENLRPFPSPNPDEGELYHALNEVVVALRDGCYNDAYTIGNRALSNYEQSIKE